MAEDEEQKREPDLDELLEEFREPEPTPRAPLVPRWAWMLMALALAVGGIWAAADATRGTTRKGQPVGSPPLPTKSTRWLAAAKNQQPADLRQDYIERCRRGMPIRQVRWLVEDFEKLALEAPPRTGTIMEFLRYRRNQHQWYLDTLRSGLRLTPEQRADAKERLAGLFDEAAATFQDATRTVNAAEWLQDERYAPWRLCSLTEEQERLTWLGWWRARQEQVTETADDEHGDTWMDAPMTSSADPLNDDPAFIGDSPAGDPPGLIGGAGAIFPFVSQQRFQREDRSLGPLLDQAMGCHPAQWMTGLLLNPGLAREAKRALETSSE